MAVTADSATPAVSRPAAALAARGIACRRGRRLLFRGLDLTLEPGAIVWLRGPNGSGKTSLLRILAGLSAPAEGAVEGGGRGRALYVGHANALKDDLTLSEAVGFQAQLQGAPSVSVGSALQGMGLAACGAMPVRTLSQGQRRRGALARLALEADAPARPWILDEPYDALDQSSTEVLTGWIERHARRGGSVLLTSHQPVALAGMRTVDLESWCAR